MLPLLQFTEMIKKIEKNIIEEKKIKITMHCQS